jgi:hypothetical protein
VGRGGLEEAQRRPKRGAGKFAEMDHGPFAAGTIDALWGGKGNWANKGLAIKLDDEKKAHVCFDPEQMRMACGWIGGGIGWPAGRDGLEGQPFPDGSVLFGTKKGSLGFSKNGDWKDPRGKVPYGPLPRDWAHWNGHYRHGEKTVLSYSVGEAEILELPAYDPKTRVFSRTFNIAKAAGPIPMLVLEKSLTSEEIAIEVAGVPIDDVAGRIEAKLPPGKSTLFIWSGPKSESADFHAAVKAAPPPADLAPLTKGGPGRNTPVTTAGVLGKEPGAFQADVLTVPYDNPSKSYMRLTGVDFFADGKRAAVCTMDGDVWTVSGIDATLEKLTWKRYRLGPVPVARPPHRGGQGLRPGRDQITRLHDLDGDGEADFYENFNNECGVTPAYHEFAHDLQTDSQGNFWYAKGSTMGGAVVPQHGSVVKVAKDGRSSERWTTGFRAPNGISIGPGDVLTTSDNQGNWIPTTPINYITKKGEFCGFVPCSHTATPPKEQHPPLCWIPYNQDNSGGGQLWATSDKWGALSGELFHLSYGKCVVFHVLREQVGDVWQGGVVKFPFKFLSGVMRGRFNPVDGQMYVVGMRGWQTDGSRDGCFQRIRYTGKPINMPLAAKVTADGIGLTFTDALDARRRGGGQLQRGVVQHPVDGQLRLARVLGFAAGQEGSRAAAGAGGGAPARREDGVAEVRKLQPVHHLVITLQDEGPRRHAISQELDYTDQQDPVT